MRACQLIRGGEQGSSEVVELRLEVERLGLIGLGYGVWLRLGYLFTVGIVIVTVLRSGVARIWCEGVQNYMTLFVAHMRNRPNTQNYR